VDKKTRQNKKAGFRNSRWYPITWSPQLVLSVHKVASWPSQLTSSSGQTTKLHWVMTTKVEKVYLS
jgi:hypothetical protein